jgi:fatty-acyl-CoA synthase
MKIAFSTLGCPDFTWPEIYAMAKDLGFDGIEIRGLGEDIYAVKAKPFTDEQLPQTIEKLKSLNIEIPCFSSGCCIKYKEREEENIKEITQYILLAAKMGAPYVRILADEKPYPEDQVDDDVVLQTLKRVIPIAEENNVTLLIETNGVYSDTSRLCELLNNAASDSVAALWDIHHPYRYANENPEVTVQNLGAYIQYVHVKDSAEEDGKICYKMMGEGDLPIHEAMLALQSINYEGIYTTTVNRATLDECALAYKPMDEIIDNIQDTVEVVDIIRPVYNFKAAE